MTDVAPSPRPKFKPDMNMTVQHLEVLGRTEYMFLAIRRVPGQKSKTARLVGTLKQHFRELWNKNRQGYGIYVQVNVSDGKGYEAVNIVSSPCLFADFDGVPIENIDRFPIAPHLLIETSPGKYHAYWPVDGIPLDRFSEMQRRLAELFASDPKVHDLPRLMRLAGFYHLKNPDAPFLSRIIQRP